MPEERTQITIGFIQGKPDTIYVCLLDPMADERGLAVASRRRNNDDLLRINTPKAGLEVLTTYMVVGYRRPIQLGSPKR